MKIPQTISLDEAFIKIQAIEQDCYVMGANDYERSAFQQIRKQMRDQIITPEEAVKMAQQILDSKQDYH